MCYPIVVNIVSHCILSASSPKQYAGISVTMDYIVRGPTPIGLLVTVWSEGEKKIEWGGMESKGDEE